MGQSSFNEINQVNAKKIVIYLAKLKDGEERSREDILKENELGGMTDAELEHRLHKLVKADLLRKGSSKNRLYFICCGGFHRRTKNSVKRKQNYVQRCRQIRSHSPRKTGNSEKILNWEAAYGSTYAVFPILGKLALKAYLTFQTSPYI